MAHSVCYVFAMIVSKFHLSQLSFLILLNYCHLAYLTFLLGHSGDE